MEQREQYYATVRKPSQQSPCREVNALERIPEYSEDIYPYATFHLPEQENLSANPIRQAYFYERSETMLQGAQVHFQYAIKLLYFNYYLFCLLPRSMLISIQKYEAVQDANQSHSSLSLRNTTHLARTVIPKLGQAVGQNHLITLMIRHRRLF